MHSLFTVSCLFITYLILTHFQILMISRSSLISVFNSSDENEKRQFSVIDLNSKNFVRDMFPEKYSDAIKIKF